MEKCGGIIFFQGKLFFNCLANWQASFLAGQVLRWNNRGSNRNKIRLFPPYWGVALPSRILSNSFCMDFIKSGALSKSRQVISTSGYWPFREKETPALEENGLS